MRDEIERYLLSLAWKADEYRGSMWVRPDSEYAVEVSLDWWYLFRFDHGSDEGTMKGCDEGESLGELKLSLAGLEAQATQGAL